MVTTNLCAAWIGILLGCPAGAEMGLFFRKEDWLGGYGTWQRRMLRLGHISFFGIGFINLAFGLSARTLDVEREVWLLSILFLIGAAGMPLVLYLIVYFARIRMCPEGLVRVRLATGPGLRLRSPCA